MNITKFTAVATLAGALLTASLTLAGPAFAAGAGGHDRPRDVPHTSSSADFNARLVHPLFV